MFLDGIRVPTFPVVPGAELRIGSITLIAESPIGDGWLGPADWQWIAENAAGSVQIVSMATHRIVALHLCDDSVARATKLFAMFHGSLSDWLARRSRPAAAGAPQGLTTALAASRQRDVMPVRATASICGMRALSDEARQVVGWGQGANLS